MGRVPPGYGKKRDGGAPKDSNDIDASERVNVGGEKEIEKTVESEDDVAKQVITSDGASCENFANGDGAASGQQITGNGFGEKERLNNSTRKPVGFMQSCCFVFVGILSTYK